MTPVHVEWFTIFQKTAAQSILYYLVFWIMNVKLARPYLYCSYKNICLSSTYFRQVRSCNNKTGKPLKRHETLEDWRKNKQRIYPWTPGRNEVDHLSPIIILDGRLRLFATVSRRRKLPRIFSESQERETHLMSPVIIIMLTRWSNSAEIVQKCGLKVQ